MSLFYQRKQKLSLLPDGKVAGMYYLGKVGSDKDHVAAVAAIGDKPSVVIEDSTERAGVTTLGVALSCNALAVGGHMYWAAASGAVALGDDIYSVGDGTVIGSTAAANATYWKVGTAVSDTATGAGDGIEFVACTPVQVTKS